MEIDARQTVKTMVRGCYDVQKLRISMGNRIAGNFKVKLGIKPGSQEADQKEADKLLKRIRADYKLITDGIVDRLPSKSKFVSVGVIDTYTELCLVHNYMALQKSEEQQFRYIEKTLEDFPIYNEFLKPTKGIGPAMAGVIISEIDIQRAHYPSSIWKYAGLDVAQDGRGRSRKAEHLIDAEYISKDGEKKERKSITFNPFLKTKLLGVLGGSFLKCKSQYSDEYYNYKNRLGNHPKYKDVSKGHRHNMANRYMIKRFLVDLYIAWRTIEGLSVAHEYSKGKLGIEHRP